MATFIPFRAVRPNAELAKDVAAAPYDIVDREAAAKEESENPYSFLHITRPDANMEEGSDPYSNAVYRTARNNIKLFIERKIFFEETKPMYYIYRMTMDGVSHTGVVGCASVAEYDSGTIMKHEAVSSEKVVDRAKNIDACGYDTEPVLLSYRHDAKIDGLIGGYIGANGPEYDFTADDGVRHELWVISDDNIISGLQGLFLSVPAFYIADGHHRSAAASAVSRKRHEKDGTAPGESLYDFFLAIAFPDDELGIQSFSRAVKGLDGNEPDEFLGKILAMGFEYEKKESGFIPDERHTVAMCLQGEWYSLKMQDKVLSDDPAESLDVTILQKYLLAPVLGIFDPSSDSRLDYLKGSVPTDELEKMTEDGYDVVFVMHPVSTAEITAVAEEGGVMPPKSTCFAPKPESGLMLYRVDAD